MEGQAGPSGARICIIHIENKGEPVKPFSHQTLEKCRLCLRVRSFHKLSYSDFVLPANEKDDSKGFHLSCYKKFTAVKKKYVDSVPECVRNLSSNVILTLPTPRDTRSQSGLVLQKSGVLKKLCMFCGKARKMFGKKTQNLRLCSTKKFQEQILLAARTLNDTRILSLAEMGDFVAKEFRYHDICDKRYRNKASLLQTSKSSWHHFRERHSTAFKFLCDTVQLEILEKEKILTLSDLTLLYNTRLDEPTPLDGIEQIKGPKLENRLLVKFSNSLLVDRSCKNHIFFSSATNLIPSALGAKILDLTRETSLRKAAFELRKQINLIDKKPLPNSNLMMQHVVKGECDIPSEVRSFVEDVVYGPSTSRSNDSYNRRIESICSDLIFASTSGRTRPRKQIMLGCVTKTLTGSKKIVNILNRLGHSINYHSVEEIETELSYSAYNADSLVPMSIIKDPNLYTCVAFNNFDRYVETMTGKDTLHDTVGIIFQNSCGPNGSQVMQGEMTDAVIAPSHIDKCRKKRSFVAALSEIDPYPKKPKFVVTNVYENPSAELSLQHAKNFRHLDLIWALNFIYGLAKTPMWTGFNANVIIDELPPHKIAYLPQINHSPTSYAVVRHTLKQALMVAEECGQGEIMCTYDLNIAKMALEIQSEDSPTFDRVFVMLGPFHIEMAFFKAIGKFIDGSGIVEILQESGVLASGSSTGFIGGTNYNRCKRIHRLLALSLRSLHYELFQNSLDQFDAVRIELPILLQAARDMRISHTSEKIYIDSRLDDHIKQYIDFENSTLQGKQGKTPQFWMIYIQLIDNYNDFVRSTKMGDISLFIKSVERIADLFFIMNHQNYARWLTPFIDNVIHSIKKKSYIGEQLRQGFFSVKRTNKSFSRTPIDLTLEQTINADAANKLSGVISTTNSISARQRWAYSHSQRTEIVSTFQKDLGLNTPEEMNTDLRPSRMELDNRAYKSILEVTKEMVNPFAQDLEQEHLFNVCSGKATSDTVQNFLLRVPEAGRSQHLTFRAECSKSKERFYQPLNRNAIKNFISDSPKIKIIRDQKITEIKSERNLLGRLLTISLKEKLDLSAVLSFPLTPVPLSLGRADGSLVKTQKSKLLKILERSTANCHDIPSRIDTAIVDGFYFIHLKGNSFQSTYGGIAHDILKKLSMYKCHSIHIIFDRYVIPSIKDLERTARGRSHLQHTDTYTIRNPQQKRPTNILKALSDNSFKLNLVKFLFEEWKKAEYHSYFNKFSLYLTVGTSCYVYLSPEPDKVICTEVEALESTHEEADSRMVYHLSTIDAGNVVVHTSDTDVLVIILGNIHHIPVSTNIWIETGTFTRNDHRFINIRKIADALGETINKCLPAFHAITGSDYTSAFFRIGKQRPFTILKKDENLQKSLAAFGQNNSVTVEEFQVIENFVCQMYRRKEIASVNELRLHMFMDVYEKHSKNDPLSVRKGLDNMSLPPCKTVLWNHVRRAKYVTVIWTNSCTANPPLNDPKNFGWKMSSSEVATQHYTVNWYDGAALPNELEEIVVSNPDKSSDIGTQSEDGSDDYSFSSSDDEQ